MRIHRSRVAFLATAVALSGACTSTVGETNPPGSDAADRGGTGDAGDKTAGRASDAGAEEEIGADAAAPDGSLDGGLADAGDGAPCPAPLPDAKQFVIFGDSTAAGWSDYGFSGPTTHETTRVCSGTQAVGYTTSHQYDGFSFTAKASGVPAYHFSARIYVSTDSDWTVAAEPLPSSDPHCYRLPLANCGEGDPACGSGQTLAPCIQHWKAGWQAVELAIPASTATVGAILFEQFSVGPIQIAIDDVRLTQP